MEKRKSVVRKKKRTIYTRNRRFADDMCETFTLQVLVLTPRARFAHVCVEKKKRTFFRRFQKDLSAGLAITDVHECSRTTANELIAHAASCFFVKRVWRILYVHVQRKSIVRPPNLHYLTMKAFTVMHRVSWRQEATYIFYETRSEIVVQKSITRRETGRCKLSGRHVSRARKKKKTFLWI